MVDLEISVDVDSQHGPIVRVTHHGMTVAVYLADETAVVTTKEGQYGAEVTGPWPKLKLAMSAKLAVQENTTDEPPQVTGSPETIWLNYGEIDCDMTHDELYRDGDITWSVNKVFDTDVRYTKWEPKESSPVATMKQEHLTVEDLKHAWNSEADNYNQWDDLGLDEIIEFAQQQIIARLRR